MLLRIYAFNAFVTGSEPNQSSINTYLLGHGTGASPLDWHDFPQLLGDLGSIQKEVLGNPMYDPSGMLVALLAMDSTHAECKELLRRLEIPSSLLDAESRHEAMLAAIEGETSDVMRARFQPALQADEETLRLELKCRSTSSVLDRPRHPRDITLETNRHH